MYKGLHIGAIGIFCIQPCLLVAGQCHCDIYCDGATGGNFHSALVQAQELMHIVSIYLAVAVHIGIVGICRQLCAQGHMIQQQLTVSTCHPAVAVEVKIGVAVTGG